MQQAVQAESPYEKAATTATGRGAEDGRVFAKNAVHAMDAERGVRLFRLMKVHPTGKIRFVTCQETLLRRLLKQAGLQWRERCTNVASSTIDEAEMNG